MYWHGMSIYHLVQTTKMEKQKVLQINVIIHNIRLTGLEDKADIE